VTSLCNPVSLANVVVRACALSRSQQALPPHGRSPRPQRFGARRGQSCGVRADNVRHETPSMALRCTFWASFGSFRFRDWLQCPRDSDLRRPAVERRIEGCRIEGAAYHFGRIHSARTELAGSWKLDA